MQTHGPSTRIKERAATKYPPNSSGTGGDGDEEVLEKEKVEKTMTGMMDGINMVVYLLPSLRMSVLIVTNGKLLHLPRAFKLICREFGDGWDKQSSTSSAAFGGPTRR